MTEEIFPEIEGIDNYVKRNYAIMEYLRYNKNFLWSYVTTYGETLKTLRNYYGTIFPIEPIKHYMKYFPIGVTKQGEIICLPKFDVCPSMMIYGVKRVGKTLMMHRIIEYFYWWLNYRIFIGNDYQNEVYAWAHPCKSTEFYKKFKTFGEKPIPLPIFLVIPYSKKDLGMMKLKTPKIRINFPIKYLIKHIEEFVDLERTKPYLKNMDFDGCKSEDKIRERIDEEFKKQGVSLKAKIAMEPKIRNMLDLFFEDDMLCFNKYVIEMMKMDNDNSLEAPIVQLLKCNVITTLITTQIKAKTWFPNYFKCIFDQIIQYKQENKEFKEKNLLIVIDELNKILTDKKIIDSIGTSIAQGGMLNMGFIGAAHHPSEINTTISGNCKYIFCFNMVSNDDVNKVKKDYNLGDQAKLIKELKQFEFIAKSKELPFILYDIKNNKIIETDFVHGFIIPPDSHHLPPAGSKKYFFISSLEKFEKNIKTTNYAKKIIIENNIKLRNPKDENNLLDVCEKESEFPKFEVMRPRLIEGVDYRRAFWRKKLNQSSNIMHVEYEFVKNSGIMVYKKNKKYFLCYVKEARDDFIPLDSLPNDVIIQYHPDFHIFRILHEKSSFNWYPSKDKVIEEQR